MDVEFGEIKSFMLLKGEKIIYYCEYKLEEGVYEADKIDEFNEFKKAKLYADRAKIVLVKKRN